MPASIFLTTVACCVAAIVVLFGAFPEKETVLILVGFVLGQFAHALYQTVSR